jgi:serine/threonine-protein kinase
LDLVIASYLVALENGNPPDRGELLQRHASLAPQLVAFFEDHDRLQGMAGSLLPSGAMATRLIAKADTQDGPSGPASTVTGMEGPTDFSLAEVPRFGDYELERELARGGMGVVYRARQRSLNRIVALKMLRSGSNATVADRQRFRSEASAVAQLEHPHIVPIYEVGEQDGQPYFSMKLFEGGSLAQHLPEYRANPRAAARLLAIVANAVDHAHQRGILHRDLKPANILLDGQGQPHVSDFGLAKRLQPEAGEAPLTQSGAILGTPSYMAPEQATGPAAAITTAVDVYALGAVLYEMLTGRPPFKGESVFDTLRQLVETAPVRPSILNSKVDHDLELICLKCLEKKPTLRYASARDLANDLNRYLNGESIQVRPANTREWLLRWCRRDPVRAGLTAGLIVSVFIFMGLICWQWRLAVDHAREVEARNLTINSQNDDLRKQKEDNEQQANFAHRTIHDLCESFQVPKQGDPVGPPQFRKELLQSAMKYYQDFLRVRGDDPSIKAGVAENYRLLGELGVAAGAKDETIDAFTRAVTLYEQLSRFQPKDLDIKLSLAKSVTSLASAQVVRGQASEGLAGYERGERLCDELIRERPKDPEVLDAYQAALYQHAARLLDTGAPGEALVLLRRAQGIVEQWTLLQPDKKLPVKSHGGILNMIGCIELHRPNALGDALASFERSLALRQEASRREPQSPWDRRDVAESYFNIGVARRDLKQLPEAEEAFLKSRDIREKLKPDLATAAQLAHDLAATYTALGSLHAAAGKKEQAIAEYRQAVTIQERLVAETPRLRSRRRDLARTSHHLGLALADTGSDEEALAVFQRARVLMEGLVGEDPDNLEFRFGLCSSLDVLGNFLGARQRVEDGVKCVRDAVKHGRFALSRSPEEPGYRTNLGCYYRSLNHLEFAIGNTAASANAAHEQVPLFAGHAPDLFNAACDLARCADQIGKSAPNLSPEQKAERDRYAGWAAEALRAAAAAGFRDGGRVRKEPVFTVLQDRDDFREALAAVEKTNGPPR